MTHFITSASAESAPGRRAHRAAWITLITVALTGLFIVDAARARRGRARKRAAKPARVDPGLPQVVVVHRKGVSEYREVARAFKARSPYPVKVLELRPTEAVADAVEELTEDYKARLVLALGPLAAKVLREAPKRLPVIFALADGAPAGGRRGVWLRDVLSPRALLAWLRSVRPRMKRLGVLSARAQGPDLVALKKACKRARITLLVEPAPTAEEAPRALAVLLGKRPDMIWLGAGVRRFDPAALRMLRRAQSLMRRPVIAQTPR